MNDKYKKYSQEELASDEAFIRWAKGLDPDKDGLWEEWLGHHPEKKEDVDSAKKMIESIAFKEDMDSGIDKKALWNKIERSVQSKPKPAAKRQPGILRLTVWAAAATIAFFLIFKPFAGKETTIFSKSGEHVELQLPGRSTVTLNANSEIGYFSKKWDEQRIIELDGEAFFDVKKGKRFVVHTKNGKVEVLGTSFNVKSRGDGFIVFCKTGKVRISTHSKRFETILNPGESASLTGNKKFKKSRIKDDSPIDWMRGVFRFEASVLEDVFDSFERQYAVEIRSNNSIDTMRYTGSFNKDEFEKALRDITWPMGLKNQIDGKTITVSK